MKQRPEKTIDLKPYVDYRQPPPRRLDLVARLTNLLKRSKPIGVRK